VPGTTYELGGPEIVTLRQVFTFILSATGRNRRLVPLSFKSAATVAIVTETMHKLSFGLFPETFVITSDQVKLLREDNIVSPSADADGRTFHGFGISPEPYEAIVPSYLYRYRTAGQFAGTRGG
jgi:hypothetical protein